MSAYVVTDRHIAYLVECMDRFQVSWLVPGETVRMKIGESEFDSPVSYRAGRDITLGQMGAILLAENIESVNYRYSEQEEESPFVYECSGLAITPIQAIKAARCFQYQACEHPTWRTSQAFNMMESLILNAIARLDGYDEAKWDIDYPEANS